MSDETSSLPAEVSTKSLAQKVEPLLRPERRQEGVQLVQALIQKTHQGPLPAPDDYAHYEAVHPGAAERILRMAESNQQHRHMLESEALRRDYSLQARGQMFAIAALIAMLALIGFTFWVGQPIAGSVLGTGTIAAIVGMFLRSNQAQPKQAPPMASKAKPPAKRKR